MCTFQLNGGMWLDPTRGEQVFAATGCSHGIRSQDLAAFTQFGTEGGPSLRIFAVSATTIGVRSLEPIPAVCLVEKADTSRQNAGPAVRLPAGDLPAHLNAAPESTRALRAQFASQRVRRQLGIGQAPPPFPDCNKMRRNAGPVHPAGRPAPVEHVGRSTFCRLRRPAQGQPTKTVAAARAYSIRRRMRPDTSPGLGQHSFRRANITWRQEIGGSAIEVSKIAGHHDLEMTSAYTFVAPERQNELTRRIQQKLAEVSKNGEAAVPGPAPELPPGAGNGQNPAPLATTLIQ